MSELGNIEHQMKISHQSFEIPCLSVQTVFLKLNNWINSKKSESFTVSFFQFNIQR